MSTSAVGCARLTIDAGFTCPNVDGTVAIGGCVFCDNRSFSPNRRLPRATVREQVRRGMEILHKRYGADKFLAYFQAATNTYAPVEKLRRLYDEALEHPQMVGLAIGTRPDCVPNSRARSRPGVRPNVLSAWNWDYKRFTIVRLTG